MANNENAVELKIEYIPLSKLKPYKSTRKPTSRRLRTQ